METISDHRRNTKEVKAVADMDDYRESIRKLIDAEVRNALDDEMRKAAQELMEEQKKAVRQLIEEQKSAIRQVVEEEKKAIWEKAESLRKSMLKLGL